LDPSDITWLSELPDELDVLIAQRDFDKAVGLIEKGIYLYIYLYIIFTFNKKKKFFLFLL